jgi:hypothetical protein
MITRQEIEQEAAWIFEKLTSSFSEESQRNYYQGRIDQLAWISRRVAQSESEAALGQALEQARQGAL